MRVARGFALGVGSIFAHAISLAGAAIALVIPAVLVYWLYGNHAGMTFWETFAWVEFVGGLIGATVMLLSALGGEEPLAAVLMGFVYVGISLGIAFGFGILGGNSGQHSTSQPAPVAAIQASHTSDYSQTDLSGMRSRCVAGGKSEAFCECITNELTSRLSPAELSQVSGAARFSDLPGTLATRAQEATARIDRYCPA